MDLSTILDGDALTPLLEALEADYIDAALDVAARIPAARLGGAVEVRPVVER